MIQHFSDVPPCARTARKIARGTPKQPPAIHWLINF